MGKKGTNDIFKGDSSGSLPEATHRFIDKKICDLGPPFQSTPHILASGHSILNHDACSSQIINSIIAFGMPEMRVVYNPTEPHRSNTCKVNMGVYFTPKGSGAGGVAFESTAGALSRRFFQREG